MEWLFYCIVNSIMKEDLFIDTFKVRNYLQKSALSTLINSLLFVSFVRNFISYIFSLRIATIQTFITIEDSESK